MFINIHRSCDRWRERGGIFYCTMTVKFMPGWTVQYNLNVPALGKGPMVAVLLPPTASWSTVGAPDSLAGLALPSCQVPLAMVCPMRVSDTSVICSPFLIVIDDERKALLSMWTGWSDALTLGGPQAISTRDATIPRMNTMNTRFTTVISPNVPLEMWQKI
jgi:hypothetical protein